MSIPSATRPFDPRIETLSQQPARLETPDTSFEALLEHFPGLASAKAVCLTGSTAAGWGNSFSDIDIYAFADEKLAMPSDASSETWVSRDRSSDLAWDNWMGRYGHARVDIQVWPTDALTRALGSTVMGEPEFYNAISLSNFIYRMSIGIPLKNPEFFESARTLIAQSSYGRSLARMLKAEVENALTDVAGQLAAGDAMSARLSALMAAAKAADMCLILAGEYCRREKWLLRRIESKPECGITVDEYRSEILQGCRPGESEADCALRVARWAQRQVVRTERESLSPSSL